MCAGNRQQGDIPRPLYSFGNVPLMLGAISRNPARNYLAPLAYKITERPGIFVIYRYLLIGAETADLPALERALLARAAAASLWGSFVAHFLHLR